MAVIKAATATIASIISWAISNVVGFLFRLSFLIFITPFLTVYIISYCLQYINTFFQLFAIIFIPFFYSKSGGYHTASAYFLIIFVSIFASIHFTLCLLYSPVTRTIEKADTIWYLLFLFIPARELRDLKATVKKTLQWSVFRESDYDAFLPHNEGKTR